MSCYLVIPGWEGSGPEHWQTHWERVLDGARRVEMPSWMEPDRGAWIATLDAAIARAAEPPVLVAHSLGCITVALWAARHERVVRGALLVAPPDLDRAGCPDVLRGFAPVPHARLPFRSRVVASDDDPYTTLQRSRELATAWGSELTVLHDAGHISTASGYGPWFEGRALLATL